MQIDLTGADYDVATLSRALVASNCRVLLVIDQFEEVFTECKEVAKREAFFACLVGAVQADNPLPVVITLRADFLAKCTEKVVSRCCNMRCRSCGMWRLNKKRHN